MMKKLTLELDLLVVESFDTGDAARGGTVRGHDTQFTEWCNSTYLGCTYKGCDSQAGSCDSCDPCQVTPLCVDTDLCDTQAPAC
jgi:hypothetical protein